jgi:enoyl-CoA hydratase
MSPDHASPPDAVVLTERRGEVLVVTLNRPEVRNAVNLALAAGICEALAEGQSARAIVLTGAPPAFCAGLDLRSLGIESMGDLPPFVASVAESAVPVIAAVNGPAVTGGLELALAADFIVASERAAFADTHLRVGVYPGPVLVDLPRRIGPAKAREMSLTGNFVDAETALRIGLANHVVPEAELLPLALSLAEAITEQDPAMVRAMREDWDAHDALPVAEARRGHLEFSRRVTSTTTGSGIAERREAVLDRSRTQRSVRP